MPMPPGLLTQKLAESFPQFILCDAGLQQDLLPLISAPTNPEAMEFVQWLQSNPDPAIAAGNVLSPPGTPSTSAVPLDPGLVQALVPVLSYAADSIADDTDFAGVAWTVQRGVAPGKQQTQPTTGGWTLTSQGPIGGLVFSSIVYADGATPGFTLTLVNDQPRHLSVYARFLKAGVPVAPGDWTSHLPAGVPAGFETATEKYLGMLLPGAKVGAIAVAGGAQQIGVPLPANADSIELLFGGLNDAGYSPIPDAAGVMLTFLLDMAVPWIVQGSGAQPDHLAKWFDGVLADNDIAATAMASGAFLLQAGSRDAMFAALSANLCTALLGTPLAGLRKSIAKKLGSPPGVSYGWVDQFAPGAGWAAQLVQAFTAGGLSPQYWPGATPPIALTLSPATLVALDLSLWPDPVSGIWPYAASACSVEIAYGGGDSQALQAAIPAPQSSAPVALGFGGIAGGGPIAIAASVTDVNGAVVASGSASITPPGGTPAVSAQLAVTQVAATVTAATRYRLAARLSVNGGSYSWNPHAVASTAVALPNPGGATPAITSLNALALQDDLLALGYAWGASNQNIPICGGTAPLQNAYFVQNIGTADPAAQYRVLGCGLVAAPLLAYAATGQAGYYLDTQGSGGTYLRPVDFGAGPFVPSTQSVAQFPVQAGLTDIGVDPRGGVAAIARDSAVLAAGAVAAVPVADAQASAAQPHAGQGTRIGLLGNPVAVAASPSGAFLVLEQANARVQAFDASGNPVPLFAGQPSFALQAATQPVYRDIAVSGDGLVYVLGSQNGGAAPSDFFLDIYNPDGTALSRTPGVNAARIAVAADNSLFTLDFDALTGLSGRIEPVVSRWLPQS